VSETSVEPDQPAGSDLPGEPPLSEDSKRKIARLARTSTLVAASLTALALGIVIGNLARKRYDRLVHAYS
jgi:hypothetical protein